MQMRRQIGGSTALQELSELSYRGGEVRAIEVGEYARRRTRALALMRDMNFGALILTAGSNLTYFTGVDAHPSERLTAFVLRADGSSTWITPAFEAPRLRLFVGDGPSIGTWQEEEDPFALLADALPSVKADVAIDETAPYWLAQRTCEALGRERCRPATPVTSGCRQTKSASEIAIIRHVMKLTLEVQRRTARILRGGITAEEVRSFVNEAHRRIAGAGSTFCIVSFGESTAYPHGGADDQVLVDGDMVLVDTGTTLHGYKSDITRTYVFGQPNDRQRSVWQVERDAQLAAFSAARLGVPCEAVDAAARACIASHGFGPNYEIPGLPHRTGHGLGLDLHEQPYLVRGNREPLREGMCCSNEPMICLYGEFGVRLEDHFYMGGAGPIWFTEPSSSITEPFAEA